MEKCQWCGKEAQGAFCSKECEETYQHVQWILEEKAKDTFSPEYIAFMKSCG